MAWLDARSATCHQGPVADPRHPHHPRLAAVPRLHSRARRDHGGADQGRRRDPHRQDQHPRVRPRLADLQPTVRRHRLRLRRTPQCRRQQRRSRRCPRAAPGTGGRRQRHDGLAAQPGGLQQRHRLPPFPRPRTVRRQRRPVLRPARLRRPDGPQRARHRPAALGAGWRRSPRAAIHRRTRRAVRRTAGARFRRHPAGLAGRPRRLPAYAGRRPPTVPAR